MVRKTVNTYNKNTSYPTFQDMALGKAQDNKDKRDNIISSNKPYVCPKCNIAKRPDEFVIQYMKNDLIGSYRWLYECKECKKKRTATKRLYSSMTIQGAIQNIYKKLLQSARQEKMAFDLAEKDIQAMWDKQDGKCYYSAYSMTYNSAKNLTKGDISENAKYHVSLDRKNPNNGYTKGNCVLCCTFIQKMKNSLDEKEFLKVCKDVIENIS